MNDTKKSFDFTGELKKLNESGVSDRRSFVEQLENVFKMPAKIDLGLIGGTDGLLDIPVPLNSYVDQWDRGRQAADTTPQCFEWTQLLSGNCKRASKATSWMLERTWNPLHSVGLQTGRFTGMGIRNTSLVTRIINAAMKKVIELLTIITGIRASKTKGPNAKLAMMVESNPLPAKQKQCGNNVG
ncbi:hypothetical protein C8J56DRAFT_1087354 [Mycena floridula]|nr:hypothetical protein C8J56DRAFT_1087354 [Mycena floridula]